MKTLIAVPTYKRFYLYKQNRGVYKYLPWIHSEGDTDIVLFLKKGDDDCRNLLMSEYRCKVFDYNYISELRFQIINYAIDKGYEYLIFMDDDVKLAYRESLTAPLQNITQEKFYELITFMSSHECMTHPTLRFGSNGAKQKLEYNKKAIRCVSIWLPQIKQLDIHQDQTLRNIGFKSDYCLQLSLLNAGCYSVCNNLYTVDDGGQIKGGCSEYRDPEKMKQAALTLKEKFPDLVKLRDKVNKTFTKKTLEVTVNWKGALKNVKQ